MFKKYVFPHAFEHLRGGVIISPFCCSLIGTKDENMVFSNFLYDALDFPSKDFALYIKMCKSSESTYV